MSSSSIIFLSCRAIHYDIGKNKIFHNNNIIFIPHTPCARRAGESARPESVRTIRSIVFASLRARARPVRAFVRMRILLLLYIGTGLTGIYAVYYTVVGIYTRIVMLVTGGCLADPEIFKIFPHRVVIINIIRSE